MFSLEDLETFLAIIDGGSLRAAARLRGVTPSLISRRLSRLEEAVGLPLILRTTRSWSLTDAGRRFEDHARDISNRVTEATDEMQGRGSEPRGRLRVAASHVYGSERIAPWFARFLRDHPKVEGELLLDDLRTDLTGAGLDAAIRIGALEDSELVARPLEPYPMGLYASPAYLASAGVPETAADLAEHDAVELAVATGRPWRLEGTRGEVRVRPRRRAVATSGHALLRMAEEGLGLIAQPRWLVERALASKRLVPVLPDHTFPTRMVHLIYRRRRHQPAHLAAFVERLMSFFASTANAGNDEAAKDDEPSPKA